MFYFRSIRISDKKNIELITSQYPEYSDFNFTSIWSWYGLDGMVSFFDDGIIFIFHNYLDSSKRSIAFLVNKDVSNEKLIYLMHLFQRYFTKSTLEFIPENIASKLIDLGYSLFEDRNNDDYVISTYQVSKLQGHLFERKRNLINGFVRSSYSDTIFVWLKDKKSILKHKNEIIGFIKKIKPVDGKEFNAINRYFQYLLYLNDSYICIARYKDKIVGFCLVEPANNNYAIGHFIAIAPNLHKGFMAKFINEVCTFLLEHDILYINIEQDLGISHLREMKMGLRPVKYTNKYIIKKL